MKNYLIFSALLFLISCTKQVPEDVDDEYIPPSASVVDKQFNFHVVDSNVWRSSQPNHESILRMKEHGLAAIVNLRGDEETDKWEGTLSDSLGINYYSKPLDAREKQDLNYLKDILNLIEDEKNQPVLVHCLGGKDRTGLLVGMYKLKHTNTPLDAIKKEMVMYGHDSSYTEVFSALEKYSNEVRRSK